jgi:hypothetical protein
VSCSAIVEADPPAAQQSKKSKWHSRAQKVAELVQAVDNGDGRMHLAVRSDASAH